MPQHNSYKSWNLIWSNHCWYACQAKRSNMNAWRKSLIHQIDANPKKNRPSQNIPFRPLYSYKSFISMQRAKHCHHLLVNWVLMNLSDRHIKGSTTKKIERGKALHSRVFDSTTTWSWGVRSAAVLQLLPIKLKVLSSKAQLNTTNEQRTLITLIEHLRVKTRHQKIKIMPNVKRIICNMSPNWNTSDVNLDRRPLGNLGSKCSTPIAS